MTEPGCVWCGKRRVERLCSSCRELVLNYPRLSAADLEKLPYGVIRLDGNGNVLSLNRAEEKLSRIDRHRAVGRNFFTEIAPCADVQDFRGRFSEFLNGTEPIEEFGFIYPFAHGPVRVHLLFVRITGESALLLVSKRALV